jgi:hypothetical protein
LLRICRTDFDYALFITFLWRSQSVALHSSLRAPAHPEKPDRRLLAAAAAAAAAAQAAPALIQQSAAGMRQACDYSHFSHTITEQESSKAVAGMILLTAVLTDSNCMCLPLLQEDSMHEV